MSISRVEFDRVREYHPTLQSLAAWEARGRVGAVVVVMQGRRGGQAGWWLWGPRGRVAYTVALDLSSIQDNIPPAWILSPGDDVLRHLNVFHGGHCPLFGRLLPLVCWGSFAQAWTSVPRAHRTLGAALEYLRQLLNHQNPHSPAR
jgi:hypothetical protein